MNWFGTFICEASYLHMSEPSAFHDCLQEETRITLTILMLTERDVGASKGWAGRGTNLDSDFILAQVLAGLFEAP